MTNENKKLKRALQEIIDSLNGDGMIILPEAVFPIWGLKIPPGVYVYGI